MNPFFFPFVSAIAANSFLNFGFGLRRLVSGDPSKARSALGPVLAILLAGTVVWPLFNYALAPLSLGFIEQLALVPVSVLISLASDALSRRLPVGRSNTTKTPDRSAHSAFDGLTYAAAFFCLHYAAAFSESLLLAVGAALGFLFCDFALRAIRERSDTEPVPKCLRGVPLMLIASALMAVLASFFAAASFAALGGAR